jgi:nucleolar GTP-binding protein
MQTIVYNFKTIPIVPDSSQLTDIVLSKTQRKTPTVVHPGYAITRIRKFYMRKIRFTYNSIEEKIEDIVQGFPKIEDIHPFYADMINILYDKDHYKLALGYINTGKNLCEKVCKDYVKLMKYGDSLYRCKQLKIAALGRMATILKKLNSSLKYLEEVRKHLGRMPSIDPFTRTLLLTGYPNVGKSSFMNKLTNAESEVQPYPFTTQSLWAGHTYYKNVKWQVIDTPGILDRPLDQRNTIEMQAINALAHLDAAILFFIDISEQCGYSLEDQLNLFNSIRPLFKTKPLVMVLNKIDIQPFEGLDQKYKDMFATAAKENNTYLIKMSNVSNEGVVDVKTTACDILLEYRLANTTKTLKQGHTLSQFDNKIHVTQPIKRDNKKRPVHIPDSVKVSNDQEKNNINNADDEVEEDDALINELRYGKDEGHEKKIKQNKFKELIESKGGDGVFYLPDREHFILENPDWKDDVMPEIMDGKNIFDFIDPDIKEKLQRLEEEEDRLAAEEANNNGMDVEEEDSDLDEELLLTHDEVMENRKKINELHKNVKAPTIPRKVRDLTITEKFMADLRTDKKEGTEKMKFLSNKQRQLEKEKTKRTLVKQAKLREENIPSSDEEEDYGMDIEGAPRKSKKLSPEEKLRREKEEKYRQLVGERMKAKIQKKFNRQTRIDESDRRIGSKLPVHLNTGKRGIGKTDRR